MKTLTTNFVEWMNSLFTSKQAKLEARLDQFVDSLNDLFLNYLDQMDRITEKNFKIEIFKAENPEVDFTQNETKKNFKQTHWFLGLLMFLCVLADFYVMREVAGQFGIANPIFGLLIGLLLLMIELTLTVFAFRRPGKEDKNRLVNQFGKFVFLFFIPAMCFLNYYQNAANQMFGATEISLQIVRYKMIIIAFFSLIIHFELVLNLENGFLNLSETIVRNKYHKMQQELDSDLEILGNITTQIRSLGGTYLREINRFNRRLPNSPKGVEYLPEGIISLINDGQMEDVIRLKNTPLTQVKPGYSRQDLIKLRLHKTNLNFVELTNENKPLVLKPIDEEPTKKGTSDEISGKDDENPDEAPESYDSFFGVNEKVV